MPMLLLQQLCNTDTPPPHKRKRSDTDASPRAHLPSLAASPEGPKLPAEVIGMIWPYCDTPTLKQVRLCCSVWARDIGMFLFDHVTLLPHIYFNTRFMAAFGSSDVKFHIHSVLVDGWWQGPILGEARPISLALGDEWAGLKPGQKYGIHHTDKQNSNKHVPDKDRNGLQAALEVLPSLNAVIMQAGGRKTYSASVKHTKLVLSGVGATSELFQEVLEKCAIIDTSTHAHLDFLHTMRQIYPMSGCLMRGSLSNVPQSGAMLVRKQPSPISSSQSRGAETESNNTLPPMTPGAMRYARPYQLCDMQAIGPIERS